VALGCYSAVGCQPNNWDSCKKRTKRNSKKSET
jgi:hypothetical protein